MKERLHTSINIFIFMILFLAGYSFAQDMKTGTIEDKDSEKRRLAVSSGPAAKKSPCTKLGSLWHLSESGQKSVWARRGSSNVFWDRSARPSFTEPAEMTISISGNQVTMKRRSSSDSSGSDYFGTIADDCLSAEGTYTCSKVPGQHKWHADIYQDIERAIYFELNGVDPDLEESRCSRETLLEFCRHYENGDYNKALRFQAENDREIQYYTGVIHYRMKNLDEAKTCFSKCVHFDPAYIMAHVYLFRIKRHFGEGGEVHYDKFVKLFNAEKVNALRVSFIYDSSRIIDFKTKPSFVYPAGSYPLHPARYHMKSLDDILRLFRIELISDDRHCVDENYFSPEYGMYYDGIDVKGLLAGGAEKITKFPVSCDLALPGKADKVVIFNPEGRKIFEQHINNN